MKQIWVLPEIGSKDEEISPLSLGLLSEARVVAEKVGGVVKALLLSHEHRLDYAAVLGQYGIDGVYVFTHPALEHFSAEAYSSAILPLIQRDKPWLFIMGNNIVGKELAPRLAALLDTGVITNCAKIDLSQPDSPVFYRPVYGDQLFQEVAVRTEKTVIVTMDARVLNIAPVSSPSRVTATVIKPEIPSEAAKIKHLEFLPPDFRTIDVADADVIVSVGAGGAADEILHMVEELAGLIQGAIGTTRPVVDTGKIPRERMVGQTGKIVNPELYMALGISGSQHHIGGIQGAKKIIAINRDPQAAIFQNSDVGVVADIKDVLPKLIEKLKQAGKSDTSI